MVSLGAQYHGVGPPVASSLNPIRVQGSAPFEPVMGRAVDLDQFPAARPPLPRLKGTRRLAHLGLPQPQRRQELAHRLDRDLQRRHLQPLLPRQRRAKVRIPRHPQGANVVPQRVLQAPVRRPSPPARHQTRRPLPPVVRHPPRHRPPRHPPLPGRLPRGSRFAPTATTTCNRGSACCVNAITPLPSPPLHNHPKGTFLLCTKGTLRLGANTCALPLRRAFLRCHRPPTSATVRLGFLSLGPDRPVRLWDTVPAKICPCRPTSITARAVSRPRPERRWPTPPAQALNG